MIPIETHIRTCKNKDCGKRFILEKGFYFNSTTNSYSLICKSCYCQKKREVKEKIQSGVYKKHKFSPFDENNISYCLRCGVESRKVIFGVKMNQWQTLYRINNDNWVKEHSPCIVKK